MATLLMLLLENEICAGVNSTQHLKRIVQTIGLKDLFILTQSPNFLFLKMGCDILSLIVA